MNTVFFLFLRRMRTPLLLLIVVYAIAIGGLVLMPGVDPGRDNVLRQLRALHDTAEANPGLVLLPAHDDAYLRDLVSSGVLSEGFSQPAAATVPAPE